MTGEPVAGASVLITWEKISPVYNHHSTAGAVVVFTDDKGRYILSPKLLPIAPSEQLDYTTLVIYQPGYQLFKIRRWDNRPVECDDSERKKNFKNTNYLVRLDRVPPVFDHSAHFESIARVVSTLDKEFRPLASRLLKRRAEWELSVKGQ